MKEAMDRVMSPGIRETWILILALLFTVHTSADFLTSLTLSFLFYKMGL